MIPTTRAEYAQKCPGCGEAIEEGDLIGLVDGDWMCENCVEDEEGYGAENGR